MALTRLANTIIDGVALAPDEVARDVAAYLGSDLVCYRATTPHELVARQAAHWDPVIAFARDEVSGITLGQEDEIGVKRSAIRGNTDDLPAVKVRIEQLLRDMD